MTEPFHCPRCGTKSAGAGAWSLCPSCLLGLAFDAGGDADTDDSLAPPEQAYRVLTVVSSERDRTTYLAEQGGTRRLVTLDVVRLSPARSADSLEECRKRLRALMGWSHRGAARVIDGRLGPSGEFCVVSEYVKGQRLDRYCESRQLAMPARARLFSAVCDTIADAHRKGICHGRLRPDLVVAAGLREDVRTLVVGFSVTPGRMPTAADDVAGLEAVGRAMGWRGVEGPPRISADAVREAALSGWA